MQLTATRLASKATGVQGPILVLGASGFVGANLFRHILSCRNDVFGTTSAPLAWRLEDAPPEKVVAGDLLAEQNLSRLLDAVRPRTVFNCIAYGAYPFEQDVALIYRTNVDLTVNLIEELRKRGVHRYVHAGSSSEYGDDAAGPSENSATHPNSHYSVSKIAAAKLIEYAGKKLRFPAVNLRLYSVYGPFEDSSRLIPTAVLSGLQGQHATYVDPSISRDFIFVDDVCEAFVDAALNLKDEWYGDSFNIGSGVKTTIGEFSALCKNLFKLDGDPTFSMPIRNWDLTDWFADPSRARLELGWQSRTSLREGLRMTSSWCGSLEDKNKYRASSKKFGVDEIHSVSAIIACYKDGLAIPYMYQRLSSVFNKLNIGYEIIFVNDGSPDDSEEVIRALSARDRRVVGISHARNFGSQAAFRSGMEVATKNACVLLDGDLQDPPELIESFVEKWRDGYDVVYGRRVKRDAPWQMQIAYKAFYRLFDAFSYVSIPHDAGDFSLMDRRVVTSILSFPERDLFIRGVRAFAGFRQAGVDYVRPERQFGVTTNNLFKNIGWAKKGILSFSTVPLTLTSVAGVVLFGLSLLLALVYFGSKLFFPTLAPRGFTSLVLIVIFFGSINLLGLSIIGEYIAKIFEEVKRRPHFIRRSFIQGGAVRLAAETGHVSRTQP
jgi:dolichol-phosphate mannosyltransferase